MFEGLSGGSNGINVTAVGTLHVEAASSAGLLNTAIFVDLTADGSQIFIKDTIMRNNGAGANIRTTQGQ